jgi:hypothetical protein
MVESVRAMEYLFQSVVTIGAGQCNPTSSERQSVHHWSFAD